jgi:hypothetical protein
MCHQNYHCDQESSQAGGIRVQANALEFLAELGSELSGVIAAAIQQLGVRDQLTGRLIDVHESLCEEVDSLSLA